jgi:POT family proton-dependent oligopeptide transporter
VLFVGAAFFQLFRGSTWEEAQRIVVVIVLCIFNIFFWMGFEQAGGTMTLFADAQTDRMLGGPSVLVVGGLLALAGLLFRRTTRDETSGRGLWLSLTVLFGLLALSALGYGILLMITGGTLLLPASQFQTINPLLIVTLAPSFSLLWNRLDSGRFRTSTPTKMALGMIILGLGFMVMYTGQKLAGDGKVSPMWLTVVYFIHTVGELCLSPIGLSMVTKLAPPRVVSLAMGLWMGSSAVANYLAGTLEKQLESSNIPIYGFLVVSSIGPALLLMALTPLLKKWMHGRA